MPVARLGQWRRRVFHPGGGLCHDIAALVEYKGLSVAEAARIVIHEKIKPAGGKGGVIVLDRRGNLAMTYSSEGMYRGYVTRGGEINVAIYRDLGSGTSKSSSICPLA